MTDFRALCAQMADELDHNRQCLLDDRRLTHPLADKARAALAEPEPEVPTLAELLELTAEWPCTTGERHDLSGCPEVPLFSVFEDELIEFTHAVLARWGNHPGSPDSSMQPIPVSERLPGDQLCWWYEPDEEDGYGGMWTLLRIRGGTACYSHWLPADALPQPS